MSKEIWIFAETADGTVAPSFYEMLSEATAIYADTGVNPVFTALVLGSCKQAAEQLRSSGVDKVIFVGSDRLDAYNPALFTEAVSEAAKALHPDVLLVAASAVGSELAPGVAARLRTGLAAHCTQLKVDEQGELHMIAPAFGGNLMGEYIIPDARPVMASIKPGVFEKRSLPAKNADIAEFSVPGLEALKPGIELVEIKQSEASELPVDKADYLVCAGFGCAMSGNLEKAKELAKRIGATMCYTRPLADLGYYPNENGMVGTSGKTVKPKVYIGFGVSGAGQHICGMKDSGVIINVNSDPEAHSFEISNYKIVADCGAVLDGLLSNL